MSPQVADVRIPARVALIGREQDAAAVRMTARSLAEHGCWVRVLLLWADAAGTRETLDGIWREHLARPRDGEAGEPAAIEARVRAFKADAVHFHGPRLLPLARRLARTLGVPVVQDAGRVRPGGIGGRLGGRVLGVARLAGRGGRAPAAAYRGLLPGVGEHGEAPAGWYEDFYRDGPETYLAGYRESHYRPALERIAERGLPADAVIDVGCGTGQLAELLAERSDGRYLGFDFSAAAVELARARLPALDFRVADAYTTPLLTEAPYDLVVCTEVLEHLDDDLGVLRRLRPGARVIATVPSFNSESHRRFFWDAGEVRARYATVLDGLEVEAVPLTPTATLFLLDGVVAQSAPRPR